MTIRSPTASLKLARGKDCLVRSPVCNHDPQTTVAAHIRRANVAGIGQKPPNTCIVWACSSCHDLIDGRLKADVDNLDSLILDAMCRTIRELWQEGIVD